MNTITKPQEWLLSAFLFALTLLFVGLLVLNLDFQAWAFERHQNQLSWYIRPILILPILFFAYHRRIIGVSVSILALFTSMIWFPVPQSPPPLVKEFLTYEKEFLQAGLTAKNVLFAFLVISFFIVIVRATWLHSWKLVGLILIITALSKIIWSYMDSGQAGLTIVVPALVGLMICLLALAFWQKKKS